jgi:hypothetical protein
MVLSIIAATLVAGFLVIAPLVLDQLERHQPRNEPAHATETPSR